MSEPAEPVINPAHRPSPDDVPFDLDHALSAVVSLRVKVPEDAFTASSLGTERAGHGVLIGSDGLIVTIGYLIIEAESVWLVGVDGKAVSGHVIGYDQESGLGLVQALEPLNLPVVGIGDSDDLREGDPVILAGSGGIEQAVSARVASRHEFAGYWEYVLDNAIFTAPPHPLWGGAGLFGPDGKLHGIGSLFVQQVPPGEERFDGNMVVPINLLKPVRDDLLTTGGTRKPPRPWLGLYAVEAEGQFVVAGLANDGPAQGADVHVGDLIVAVAGQPVPSLAALFRSIWAVGAAGVEVPLTVLRDGTHVHIRVPSAARADFFKSPRLH